MCHMEINAMEKGGWGGNQCNLQNIVREAVVTEWNPERGKEQ